MSSPRPGAYHEIWYGKERVATSDGEEPFYGRTYMPRKFKIGFVVPPSNDIDVYSQDLGFIIVTGPDGTLEGFNVAIGGGMGRSDQDPGSYPRLADVIGYIPKERLVATADAVMSVQRDYGNRVDRSRARFKYTIDAKGLDFIKSEIERRLGAALGPARPFEFTSNGDVIGWRENGDGSFNLTLFILSGRLSNRPGKMLMDGLREIANLHKGKFRLTPNQNLIVADIPGGERPRIEAILAAHGLGEDGASALRRNAIACVALPTCPLAMAEAERYLPDFTAKVEAILAENGLTEEPITMRISGCPNGCSRPYIAEIALTGRAPGKYTLWLGGGFHGERLNRPVLDNAGESAILATLSETLGRYARERRLGEHFGDFLHRSGFFEPEPDSGTAKRHANPFRSPARHRRSAMFLFVKQIESHPRSFVKAVSWRILGSLDTFIWSLIMTGSLGIAGSIAGFEVASKIFLFYFHERLWDLVPWGRRKQSRVPQPALAP